MLPRKSTLPTVNLQPPALVPAFQWGHVVIQWLSTALQAGTSRFQFSGWGTALQAVRSRFQFSGWGTALQAGRSRFQFPKWSWEFFIDIMCQLSWNQGNWTSCKHQSLPRHAQGLPYLYIITYTCIIILALHFHQSSPLPSLYIWHSDFCPTVGNIWRTPIPHCC
jgi:hypothetical protein